MAKALNSNTSDISHLPESYESAVQELEQLIASLEGGQLPLDQLLNGYKRGTHLLGFCRARLQAVQDQIKVLDGETLIPWTNT
jgi:exodeoxyribonuclease VII small subunit